MAESVRESGNVFPGDTVNKMTELARKFQEDALAKDKLINDLRIAHIQELKRIREEAALREKKLLLDLDMKHTEIIKKLQEENIQFVDHWKKSQEAQTYNLARALVEARSTRNRIMLAFSWAAVAAIVMIALEGNVHEALLRYLMWTATILSLAFIFSAVNNIRWNQGSLKEGEYASMVQEASYKRLALLFPFALMSTIFLWLATFVYPAGNGGSPKPEALPVQHFQSITETVPDFADAAVVAQESKPVETQPVKIKKQGNGGNFAGGYLRS